MLRSTGSVAVLALLLIGCGGGGSNPGPPPPPATYAIGGTVSGLNAGQSVILQNNGGDDLKVSANGPFTLGTRVAIGGAYAVTVTAPKGMACSVANGSGTVSATINNVNVACGDNTTFLTGGTAFIGDLFFLANSGADSISEFSTDATSGALLPVGPPVAAGQGPTALVGTINDAYFGEKYLYVSNSRSNDVSAFAVDAGSGALTAVPGSPFVAGTSPGALAVFASTACSTRGGHCHTDENLYVAGLGSVFAYRIDQTTGTLVAIGAYATGTTPSAMAVHYDTLYIANAGDTNDISAFRIDGIGGGLSPIPGSPFPSNGNVSSLALGAGDAFQYPQGVSNGTPNYKGLLYAAIASGGTTSIMGFSIRPYLGDPNDAIGALTALPGFPYDLPSCSYIIADQTGVFLYAAAGTSVFGFGIDPKTGALSPLPGTPVAVGSKADSLSIDPTNQFLYVTNRSTGTVIGFGLNTATGALTLMAGSFFSAGNQPQFVATF